MPKFTKSRGLTRSEQILAEICERSFLSLWSYANLFKKSGEELCDLLVVFGDILIIFSDKSCDYKQTSVPEIGWKRWYKRSVLKSAHQARQAERWIRTYPNWVFLDSQCSQQLPLAVPENPTRIFRICVVSGGCPFEFATNAHPDEQMGIIGRADEGEGWVHVIDGQQLLLLLTELSTVGDFVDYLEKKEASIHDRSLIWAGSELAIAAYFVRSNRALPAAPCGLCLPHGLWEALVAHPQHKFRVQRDKLSEIWDYLIERVVGYFVASELEDGSEIQTADFEKMMRFMARERRFPRRVLSRWIFERLERATVERMEIGSFLPSSFSDLVYVLLVDTGSSREEHDEYRRSRRQKLSLRCHAIKCVVPSTRFVMGIALDASRGRGGSEDFMLIDTIEWTDEDFSLAETMRQDLNYFVNGVQSRLTENEYPDD